MIIINNNNKTPPPSIETGSPSNVIHTRNSLILDLHLTRFGG